MPIRIAEYLGVDVSSKITINPAQEGSLCPFSTGMVCKKMKSSQKPICSIRKTNDDLWMVCRHRLCSSGGTGLSEHQNDILLQISREIFDPSTKPDQVIYKKEVKIPTGSGTNYHGDFILGTLSALNRPAPSRVMVEMQGGGETSNTGIITKHVAKWEKENTTNEFLSKKISGVGSIETNAWRRQQEQFLVKGHIASQSGFGIVLCVGSTLYDYLKNKLNDFKEFNDMKNARWDFVLMPFKEDVTNNVNGSIKLIIDKDHVLYTTFHKFAAALVSQGQPVPELFEGTFHTLAGREVNSS